jgi:hypothetical protein
MEMDRAHFKETNWRHRLESARCQKERAAKELLEKDNRRGNNRDGKDLERGSDIGEPEEKTEKLHRSPMFH